MDHPDFNSIVNQVWEEPGEGVAMFRLMCKLKSLKPRLKVLNKESFSNISVRTFEARVALRTKQLDLQQDPNFVALAKLEKCQRRTFLDLHSKEESFFRQKFRIKWFKEGDRNSKFFHHYVNKRQVRNRILSVMDASGIQITDLELVHQHFVSHFQDLLSPRVVHGRPSVREIQEVIRLPLSADQLVTTAVKDFFISGRLLREINNVILILVPKSPNATSVDDYRPIACCNIIYKCITKVMANRIAAVFQDVIGPLQSAFVKGRRIRDNILLAQELFSSFHLHPYSPKCAVKVDFKKAYDTIDWEFLETILLAFGFPNHMTRLIMTCVKTPKFSIALNGELHGFFASGRGHR
ncbi:uncharacterized protein LOC104455367 [Eucalyptus grandis]|uniref:uncharacterized protein LOC104455367 n=1 Tax=Eucalyptus grandis TaxID=71139 RepID=UPI00192F0525|nr:uncharacterized protein LOC104455367 [Eucalyptus grandis]